jgi:Mn-dependent DtxR family transcriptional regulator
MTAQIIVTLNIDSSKVSEVINTLEQCKGVNVSCVQMIGPTNLDNSGRPVEPSFVNATPYNRRRFTSEAIFEDPRAVVVEYQGGVKLDAEATLKNMGITAQELLSRKTRNGTLERSVKASLQLTGKGKRKARA